MRTLQQHPHLTALGITNPNRIYWQLNTPQLYEEAVQRHEGFVAHLGPLVVRTGSHTSLSYSDRYIVADPPIEENISWGSINRPYNYERFNQLERRMAAYFQGLDVFVQDGYARTGQNERLGIRVITETAWHNLFVRNNYITPEPDALDTFRPDFTVIHAPGFRAVPERDGTNTDVFVVIHLLKGLILIGGTSFAGEIQKAIFSVINYMLPRRDVLTMECASNIGDKDDVALFLGVDGSGKTTLATDSTRILIGDSEHGWDEDGIFSVGRGCYAKMLGLTMEDSTDIWQTTRRFGTILENVVLDPETRYPDLADGSFTENTRASYPITHVLHGSRSGVGGHPRNILLLSMDAYGVLPPVSQLTVEQAQYFFLSGYTTEFVTNEDGSPAPEPRFIACYGAPFMPLRPVYYAKMFAENLRRYQPKVWLLNTGWIGGSYGKGERIPLDTTRRIVNAILNGKLEMVPFKVEESFGLNIPTMCPGVPQSILDPSEYWSNGSAYAQTVKSLLELFSDNFGQYVRHVDESLRAAQPGRMNPSGTIV